MKMIILGCLAFMSSVAQPLNGQSPAAPVELLSVVKPRFEIYAPRQAFLARAVEALEHAGREYKRYFGKDAPKIAVVLYDIPEQARKYDKAEFRKRGLGLLKWKALTIPKIALIAPLSVIITKSPVNGRPQVLAPFPEGPVAGIDLQRDDVLLSINNHPVRNMEDVKREMAAVAVGTSVTLKIERSGRRNAIRFVRPEPNQNASSLEVLAGIVLRSDKVPVSRSTIAHEAMHQLVRDGLSEGLNSSNLLPAWYSEGTASLAEFPGEREQARKRIREHLKTRIELSRLFTMPHPSFGGAITPSGSPGSGLPVMITANIPEGEKFYEQSMTLLEFLADTEGERFVGQIGEALMRNEHMEEVLTRARKSPKNLNELDAAWVKWLTR